MTPTLKIRRLTETATLPAYAKPGDAGMDLCAAQRHWVPADGVPTRLYLGIAVEIPEGYEGTVRPRSGLSMRGRTVVLGTIDSGYRGEIGVVVCNDGVDEWEIAPGDRIAQLVISPVARCHVVEVDALSDSVRGESGFGSTGVSASETHDVGAGSTNAPNTTTGKGCDGSCAPRGCEGGAVIARRHVKSLYDRTCVQRRHFRHEWYGKPGGRMDCRACGAIWEPVGFDANGAPVGTCPCGSEFHPAHECGGR